MKVGPKLTSPYSKKFGFSVDKNLGSNLELWRNAVMHQDIDCAIIVDGKEGAGKSVLALQIAHILDKDHSIDLDTQVCYYPDQFKKAITTLAKFKAIVWDEARRGVNRRRYGSKTNLDITDLLAECRQNNLFLVIVMPTFYDMDMNVAVWRTRLLIHVLLEMSGPREAPLVRGGFRCYVEGGKRHLYTDKRLRQRYEYPNLFRKGLSFDGRFPHFYVVDEEGYRRKKKEAEEAYRTRKDNAVDPTRCPECGLATKHTNMTEGYRACHKGHKWSIEKRGRSATA